MDIFTYAKKLKDTTNICIAHWDAHFQTQVYFKYSHSTQSSTLQHNTKDTKCTFACALERTRNGKHQKRDHMLTCYWTLQTSLVIPPNLSSLVWDPSGPSTSSTSFMQILVILCTQINIDNHNLQSIEEKQNCISLCIASTNSQLTNIGSITIAPRG